MSFELIFKGLELQLFTSQSWIKVGDSGESFGQKDCFTLTKEALFGCLLERVEGEATS